MRVAVLSDIHGNLVALDAVLADLERVRPNLIVQGGDIAYIGARPAEVVDRIRELGWPGVHGNTDEMLWSGPPVGHPTPAKALAWSRLRLGPARLAWLRALPIEWRHDDEIAVVHAVPGDVWPGVPADAPDDLLDETYRRLEARIAVYAHIHVPFVRHLKGLTVANSGSVGLPLDGDTRSSYLLIDDDQIQVGWSTTSSAQSRI